MVAKQQTPTQPGRGGRHRYVPSRANATVKAVRALIEQHLVVSEEETHQK